MRGTPPSGHGQNGLVDDDPHGGWPCARPADLAENDPLLTELLFHELVDRGIYLADRGYIALSAAITNDDCDVFVNALTGAISAIEAARP